MGHHEPERVPAAPEATLFRRCELVEGGGKERITDDLFGDWQITRGTPKAVCQFTLGNTAFDSDSFVLIVKLGCDGLITRFAPVPAANRPAPPSPTTTQTRR